MKKLLVKSRNPLDRVRRLPKELVVSSDAHESDRPIQDAWCCEFDGVDDYIEAVHLLGTETVTEHFGVLPIVSAGRIDFPVGKSYGFALSDGTKYNLGEKSGNIVFDSSGNGNHGTLMNGVSRVIDNTMPPEADSNNLEGYTRSAYKPAGSGASIPFVRSGMEPFRIEIECRFFDPVDPGTVIPNIVSFEESYGSYNNGTFIVTANNTGLLTTSRRVDGADLLENFDISKFWGSDTNILTVVGDDANLTFFVDGAEIVKYPRAAFASDTTHLWTGGKDNTLRRSKTLYRKFEIDGVDMLDDMTMDGSKLNTIIPAINATTDALGNPLQYSGNVYPVQPVKRDSYCGVFDGVDDYVEHPKYATNTHALIELEAVFFVTDSTVAAHMIIASMNNADAYSGFYFTILDGTHINFRVGTTSGYVNIKSPISQGWHACSVKMTGLLASDMIMEIDGIAQPFDVLSDTLSSGFISVDKEICVGARFTTYPGIVYPHNGEIAYVSYKSDGAMVLETKFSEGVGNTIYDTSGNGHHGTVMNADTTVEGQGFWAGRQDSKHFNLESGFSFGADGVRIPAINAATDALGNPLTNPAIKNAHNRAETQGDPENITVTGQATPASKGLTKPLAFDILDNDLRINTGNREFARDISDKHADRYLGYQGSVADSYLPVLYTTDKTFEIAAVFAPTTSATDTIQIDRTGGTGISVEVDGVETIYTGTTNTITLPLIDHDFLVKATVLGGVLSFCEFQNATIKALVDADTSNVTTLYYAWSGCSSLTALPVVLDTSNVTDMSYAWLHCSSLTKMPDVLDTSKVTNIRVAWYNCSSLTKMPDVLDTSNANTIAYAWYGCSSLIKMPDVLDTSKVVDMKYSWYNCSSLTQMPDVLDTSSVTTLYATWSDCTSLTKMPDVLDTSSVTNMSYAWHNCSSLTKIPDVLDTSSVTTMNYTWYSCTSLTELPDVLDTSSVTTLYTAWYNCSSLTAMPDVLDTSNVTNMYATWYRCESLTKMPDVLDTSNVTNIVYAWYGCSSLTHIANADFLKNTQCIDLASAFTNCALVESEVDKILVNLNSNNTSAGTLGINGGTNATPSQAGKDAADALVGRGWAVTLNGYTPTAP